MARTVKILLALFILVIISSDIKAAEVIKAEPVFTTTTPIVKPHIVEPPSKPVQTMTPDLNYVPKVNQNTNVPVVKNATLNITTSPSQQKPVVNTNNNSAGSTVILNPAIPTGTPPAKPIINPVTNTIQPTQPVVKPAVNQQSTLNQSTNTVKPVSTQTAVQNPAVIPQNISFQKCTKIFPVDCEKLFYLAIASINANRFTINEIQSKSGYVLFSVLQKQFLLSVANVDKKNAIVKITPANNNYYFPEGIVTNIFKYIDLNTDKEILKI